MNVLDTEIVLSIFLPAVSCSQGIFVEPLEPITSQRSLADSETRLPCHYQADEEKVVQVTWLKEHADGTKEQIITAHFTDGHTGRLQGGAQRWRSCLYNRFGGILKHRSTNTLDSIHAS